MKSGCCDNLFVSYQGKELKAGDLANAITLELAACGYQYRANCTKFRKMTVTMVCSFFLHIQDFSSLVAFKIKMSLYIS